MLLENGNPVFGVEPNAEMRKRRRTSAGGVSELHQRGRNRRSNHSCRSQRRFRHRRASRALVRSHERPRREFVRILKPGGWLVLLWNERLTDSTPFLRDYEQLLLTYGTDYQEVRHERTTESVNEFFDPAPFQERVFDMRQEFDYAGVEGRLLSSSYAPGPDIRNMRRCCASCERIFEQCAVGKAASPSNTRRGSILDSLLNRLDFEYLRDLSGKSIAVNSSVLRGLAIARRKIFSHDARRIPPPRPCRGRLDRRLPVAHRIISRALASEAGADSRLAAREPSRAGRTFRRAAERCRQSDSSRHHALAVAKFLRLLSLQRLEARNSRRPSLLRLGRARHAVVHQSRLYRTGNSCSRLARSDARDCRKNSFRRARAAA